jgi:glycosyltransferase involved in cell wall biosynthesis
MKLAIVIPAYKEAYFRKTLDCLVRQTNRNFNVYIGDDASPHPLGQIAASFASTLELRYTRFPNNIGAKNLVEQWRRCVALTQNEEWLWLFSDDDLASPNCVELFYDQQARRPSDVYRFNTRVIDGNDQESSPTLRSPDYESSEQMAYHLLHWQRGNSMPDHIFSREVYQRKGGFVFTPFAQGADWATSILFSQDSGMNVLQEGMISWRSAGQNVSSLASKNQRQTVLGHYAFIEWVLTHFRYLRDCGPKNGIGYKDIRDAAAHNLREVIIKHYRGIPARMYFAHLRFLRKYLEMPSLQAFRHLASIVYNSEFKPS